MYNHVMELCAALKKNVIYLYKLVRKDLQTIVSDADTEVLQYLPICIDRHIYTFTYVQYATFQKNTKETICLQLPLGNKTVELYYIHETHFLL